MMMVDFMVTVLQYNDDDVQFTSRCMRRASVQCYMHMLSLCISPTNKPNSNPDPLSHPSPR